MKWSAAAFFRPAKIIPSGDIVQLACLVTAENQLKVAWQTHIAIQEKKDGKVVDWMEHVTDEQYGG